MSASVKMSSKHQIVVPREAREALGLRPGDRLLVTVMGDVIEMRAEPHDVVTELEGLLSGSTDAGGGLWLEARGE
ncbi:MAG: AbrB/MazE/SpoVT family DNA-binding domain-containing protein [Gemmatimonadetes bacterium]|nr:AbrB/MazE/SpoVT family DNA-binding domain-containing protein [Gemmatimonadota bacterium]MCK5488974.1 AbrB/MazE/SpoVT family DNA-binding domain-containing protein [Gemmatimonadota bacterium]